MKHLIFYFLIFSLIFICKKNLDLPYSFTGKVTDINGNPISNVVIELDGYYPPGSILSNGYAEELAKVKTDNTGNFTAKFNYKDNLRKFYIIAKADNYFTYYTYNVFINNINNSILTHNITLYKIATIKVSFKNTTPFSNTDEFWVFHSNEMIGNPFDTFIERNFSGGTYNNLESKYIGSAIQGYVLTKTKGDTYTIINWGWKKNGITTSRKDTLVVIGGTQGVYNINY